MNKKEWVQKRNKALEGLDKCGHSETTKGCEHCDKSIDVLIDGLSILFEQEKNNPLVVNVMPAVCATCHNVIDNRRSWREFEVRCEFDENILVANYDFEGGYENWTQTCRKWILSYQKNKEIVGKDADIMYHSCHGRDGANRFKFNR